MLCGGENTSIDKKSLEVGIGLNASLDGVFSYLFNVGFSNKVEIGSDEALTSLLQSCTISVVGGSETLIGFVTGSDLNPANIKKWLETVITTPVLLDDTMKLEPISQLLQHCSETKILAFESGVAKYIAEHGQLEIPVEPHTKEPFEFEPWYFPHIDRQEAERILSECNYNAFLIRHSSRHGSYAVSFWNKQTFSHMIISPKPYDDYCLFTL